jgi:16S rRNA (cytosine1402-N4)-methyltransferase
VLLPQVLAAFEGCQLQCLVDGTLGAGGHASALLAAHPELRLFVGLDQDTSALALAQPRCAASAAPSTQLSFQHRNFREFAAALASLPGRPPLSGALFDLGMSSMQVDQAGRGFSFARDGPLDMRMDASGAGASCEDLLASASEEELGRILREYGEERRWRPLARRMVQARFEGSRLRTTRQLAELCAAVLGHPPRSKGGASIHPATRTFQALRIAVNAELQAVEQALPAVLDLLAPGGRLAVISFHSLEDRIVKQLFRKAAGRAPPDEGEVFRGRAAFAAPPPPAQAATVRLVTTKPLVADEEEASRNARARSAKLRVCEKL